MWKVNKSKKLISGGGGGESNQMANSTRTREDE